MNKSEKIFVLSEFLKCSEAEAKIIYESLNPSKEQRKILFKESRKTLKRDYSYQGKNEGGSK